MPPAQQLEGLRGAQRGAGTGLCSSQGDQTARQTSGVPVLRLPLTHRVAPRNSLQLRASVSPSVK